MCPRFLIFCLKILNVLHIFHIQYCTANDAELTQNNIVFGNKSTERSYLIRRMRLWIPNTIQACFFLRNQSRCVLGAQKSTTIVGYFSL